MVIETPFIITWQKSDKNRAIYTGGGRGGVKKGRVGMKVAGGMSGNDKIDYGGVSELQMSNIREK